MQAVKKPLQDFDAVYEAMYRKARLSVIKDSRNIEGAIKVIIFGSFYIEALINKLVRRLLLAQMQNRELAAATWEAVEKSTIPQKLFIALSPSKDLEQIRGCVNRGKRIFDVRNKLVHYKETVGIDGLVCILRRPEPDRNAAPEPEFVRDLTSGNIGKYLESIETLIEDVKGMFSRYGLD